MLDKMKCSSSFDTTVATGGSNCPPLNGGSKFGCILGWHMKY